MRHIEIDDDIYDYLVRNTHELGESATQILRRLLNLSDEIAPAAKTSQLHEHELSRALADRRFTRFNSVVDRFLYILSSAYAEHKVDFEKVLSIKGRDRVYFAKKREDIERTGTSTQPRSISGSSYWVMTNSPTPQKQEMLEDVLTLLGYSEAAIKSARSSLVNKN